MSQHYWVCIWTLSKLDCNYHIDIVRNKVAKHVSVMNRVKHVLTSSALCSLHCTLVMPYLTYCCEVCGNTYKTRIQSLFILQKRAIRICLNTNYKCHTKPLFYQLRCRPERTRGEQLRGDGEPADLKKTERQGHEHLCHTSMHVRNGNLGSDRTTTTQAASVRKQLGPKNSKSNESRLAKNGGVKGRDGSAEELDRETGEEQITVGWTRRKDGR